MPTETDMFPTSGKPNYIEWYQCYRDPSKDTWVDGMERLKLSNDEQRKWWDFFYRPVRSLVGRPQLRRIYLLKNEKKKLEVDIKEQKDLLFIIGVAGLIFATGSLLYSVYVSIFFIFASGLFCLDTYLNKSKLSVLLKEKHGLIKLLEGEVSSLLKQVPKTPSKREADDWVKEVFQLSELMALREITHNHNIEYENIADYIKHPPISDNGVKGLLIDCWGLLQPREINSPYGLESTGYNRVIDDILGNIATWRVKSDGSPLYRVIYMQHIFLLDKNINVYGFFYDFVTGKKYGKRKETFQYGHITNFSINEVEFNDDSMSQDRLGISNALIEGLSNTTFEAFTLTVSSGVNFRCVLTTETVLESMNDWLELEKRHKEIKILQSNNPSEEIVENEDLNDEDLKKKWDVSNEKGLNLEELESEVVIEKMKLAKRESNIVDKVIQQVRERVESPQTVEVNKE